MDIKKILLLPLFILLFVKTSDAQQETDSIISLQIPVFDFAQNTQLPFAYPSMNQALAWSNDMYSLAYWGIDVLGNKLISTENSKAWKKPANKTLKYALGFLFAKYGSELPIPLGVWAHEEFHRAVLGVNGLSPKNGNWIFSRWDGTVYGVSDAALDQLKTEDNNQLLYAYTAGIQYEVLLNEKLSLQNFYGFNSIATPALLLYNAYYSYNYFNFSTSAFSDSVKVLAPPHESSLPEERDFAGADLTAWAHDMFNPELSFSALRDSFPGGDGVNRRVGFSDLSVEAQDFLEKEKKLSWLNFLNPAIFFIPKIKLNNQFSFLIFAQHLPTHFGHQISIHIPMEINNLKMHLQVNEFQNAKSKSYGLGLSAYEISLTEKLSLDAALHVWNQPENYWSEKLKKGFYAASELNYVLRKGFSVSAQVNTKTAGFVAANPYLKENTDFSLGLKYRFSI